MSAIIGQVLPFLSQEHQQQVATAVERAKQVTMSDLNSAVAGVGVSKDSSSKFYHSPQYSRLSQTAKVALPIHGPVYIPIFLLSGAFWQNALPHNANELIYGAATLFYFGHLYITLLKHLLK